MTHPRDKRGRFLPRKGKAAPPPSPQRRLNPAGTQEALAQAIWEFVLNGEVTLNGHTLKAENSREWAAMVKLLYTYLGAPSATDDDGGVTVRVVRDDDGRKPNGD